MTGIESRSGNGMTDDGFDDHKNLTSFFKAIEDPFCYISVIK